MQNLMLKLYTKAQMLREEHGQDLIEYTLLAALIAVVCIAGMKDVATAVGAVFTDVKTALDAA